MSDYGSCRISSANDGEQQISSLPIRHNQSDDEKAGGSSCPVGLGAIQVVAGDVEREIQIACFFPICTLSIS